MALETWLIKVKAAISSTTKMSRKSNLVGVLAFEIAGLMSKILHLWQSLSEKNVMRLRNEATSLEGVRKIVSNDDNFLLGLACAEVVENLRIVAKSVSRLCKKTNDPNLQCFDCLFQEFVDCGNDPHHWMWSLKEMEVKQKKIDRYVTSTACLYKEIEALSEYQHGLKKLLQCSEVEQLVKEKKIIDLQQKIFWQKQEVKYLKDTSLWSKNFEVVALLLARSVFTTMSRIKLVFGIGSTVSLPRSSSVSAMVYPSHDNSTSCEFISGPLDMCSSDSPKQVHIQNLFESNSKLLTPPPTTLGGAGLSLHYANLIIVMEKMIRSPQLVGKDARDDIYGMLPASIRVALRARLRGIGFSASDPVLAGEWRDALGRILGWLSPLAHNMIKWQSERSFEQQSMTPKTNVLLLQTLIFANQAKTEAAITELLVGLNYIWRFEREMNAKNFSEFDNFNGSIYPVSSS